jgi:hypothetical protein
MYKVFILIILMLPGLLWLKPASADEGSELTFNGHGKFQFISLSYPDESLFRDLLGATASNQNLETRLKFSAREDRWDFKLDYQFIAIHGDSLALGSQLPGNPLPTGRVISDNRRWWNLTYSFGNDDNTAIVHRLDRLSVGFTTERTAWRFGRQAISWGNGLIFNPVDVFNPFDPAAVDKEYKTGDDMLYGQILFDSGNDLQGVAIVRRDPRTGEVERDHSSAAVKYHGFIDMNEFDLLAAEHFGDDLLGFGGNISVGGAVLRGDITLTRTKRDSIWSAVSSLSYSWAWGGRNVSGVLEYYYNGFGQAGGSYSGVELANNPDLLKRLERGELFTLGRHYLGASATVEMTPLFLLSPNLFINLEDPSMLAQLVAQYDWKQNLVVLAALNLPVGGTGTEYGGIESPVEGRYFSTGPSLFAQLAWYF